MEYISTKLTKLYPDVHLIEKIIDDLVETHNTSYSDKKWDGKWRPLPLLIGVLYKLQERKDKLVEAAGEILHPASWKSQDLFRPKVLWQTLISKNLRVMTLELRHWW